MMVPDVAGGEICDTAAKSLFLTADRICDYIGSFFTTVEEWRCVVRRSCVEMTL